MAPLLHCECKRTIQGRQIPLWVQLKRKLLISIGHPVYKWTVNIFSDEITRIASLYKIWLDVFCNHFAGMLYSPRYCLFSRHLMWETDRQMLHSFICSSESGGVCGSFWTYNEHRSTEDWRIPEVSCHQCRVILKLLRDLPIHMYSLPEFLSLSLLS